MDRRSLLRTLGSGALLALAGCASDPASSSNGSEATDAGSQNAFGTGGDRNSPLPPLSEWFGPEVASELNAGEPHVNPDLEYLDSVVQYSPSRIRASDPLREPMRVTGAGTDLEFGEYTAPVVPDRITTRIVDEYGRFDLLVSESGESELVEGLRDTLDAADDDDVTEYEGFEIATSPKRAGGKGSEEPVQVYDAVAVKPGIVLVVRSSTHEETIVERATTMIDTYLGTAARFVDESARSRSFLETLGDGFYVATARLGRDVPRGLRLRLDDDRIDRRVVVVRQTASEAEETADTFRELIDERSEENDAYSGRRSPDKFHVYAETSVRTDGSTVIFDGVLPADELAPTDLSPVN